MSAFAQSKNKFSISNPKVGSVFQESDFFKWSEGNFYRTSTNDMSKEVSALSNILQVPARKKSTVIPGYAGYVPRIAVNNHHLGKTIAEQSREVFNEKTLDTPVNLFSSTGFNSSLIPKTDAQLHATSRRFGTETLVRTAENHQPLDYSTTTMRASYLSPQTQFRSNWRTRDNSVQFDNSSVLKIKELQSDKLASGYSACRQHWDGTFWRTEPNTHTDQVRTLYRL